MLEFSLKRRDRAVRFNAYVVNSTVITVKEYIQQTKMYTPNNQSCADLCLWCKQTHVSRESTAWLQGGTTFYSKQRYVTMEKKNNKGEQVQLHSTTRMTSLAAEQNRKKPIATKKKKLPVLHNN